MVAAILDGGQDEPALQIPPHIDSWLGRKEWTAEQASWLAVNVDPHWKLRPGIGSRGNRLHDLGMVMTEALRGHVGERGKPADFINAMRKLSIDPPWMTHPASAEQLLDKPMREIERRTLLVVIEALARHAKIDTGRHEAAGAIIERLTDEIGAHVDSGTIARHLKKIPDALEARTK
ncbi:hypothetical protein [Imhoffiella purpurea]|nr:hypothetical protein [Imhoffiella purpurea]